MTVATDNSALSEAQISDAFHSYLKSSLAQAKAERLLDTELLSSAEGDLMITGPALCMYFAALRSTTTPPSVPLPRTSKSAPPTDLSQQNCPPAFTGFLIVWSRNVAPIQALLPEYQHDLARIVCGLEPLASPINPSLNRIAAELRAVAIEISQRRTFQDRYAGDLQAAIDAGGGEDGRGSGLKVKASFVPPPMYDEPPASPATRLHPSPSKRTPARTPSASSTTSTRSQSPTFLAADAPAIELIRETLYASLADVLVSHPTVRAALARDPPRAYFAAVALAVLDVSRTRTHSPAAHPTDDAAVSVVGVLGAALTVAQCPPALKPFMRELAAIGRAARAMEDEDDALAVQLLQRRDAGALPRPRMERVRKILAGGVASEHARNGAYSDDDAHGGGEDSGRRSVEGRAVAFANRINALALGMTKLRAFRERQDEVFKVLAGVTS